MLFNGVVIASVAVDAQGRLRGKPKVSAPGLFEGEDPELDRVAGELSTAMGDFAAPLLRDDQALTDATKAALRRALGKRLAKRPMVDVHLMRV
jgi:ribonuclease J